MSDQDLTTDEPEICDFVGVVFGRTESGRFDAYRVYIANGKVTLDSLKYGEERLKKSALRVMTLDLTSISQAITRGEIEFVVDEG